jgi:hypothetical protein
LVDTRGRDDSEDAASGPIELGSRDSAWERMLQTLSAKEDVDPIEDGLDALRATIAERLHTRGASPKDEDGRRDDRPRSARRRRR